MTSVSVPSFIFGLFQNEVISVLERALDAIALETDTPRAELQEIVERHLGNKMTVISPEDEGIRIAKVRPRKVIPNECRCVAHVKRAGGIVGTCSFSKVDGGEYCKRHAKQAEAGTLKEVVPDTKVRKLRKFH